MAAREVIHSGLLEAQPILHARFSAFASPERVAPRLKTQHVLFNHASDGPAMPMPIQMLTILGRQ